MAKGATKKQTANTSPSKFDKESESISKAYSKVEGHQKRLADLYKEIRKLGDSELEQKKKINAEIEKTRKLIKAQEQEIQKLKDSFSEIDETVASIGKTFGKNDALFKQAQIVQENIKNVLSGQLKINKVAIGKDKKKNQLAHQAATAYKKTTNEILKGIDAVARGEDVQVDVTNQLQKQREENNKLIAAADKRTKAGKELVKVLNKQLEASEKMAKATERAAIRSKKMREGAEGLSGTSLGSGINNVLGFTKKFGGKYGSLGDVAKEMGKKEAAAAAGAGGGSGMLGGMLRMAGPIAAAAGVLYAAASALNNGAFIKYTMLGKATFGASPQEIRESGRAQYELTKEYRDIVTEYNYILPLKREREARRQMVDYQHGLLKDQYDFERGLIKDRIDFEFQKQKEIQSANLNQAKEAASLGINMSSRGFTISAKNLETMGISLTEMVDLSAKMAGKFGISGKEADKIAQSASVIKNRLGLSAEDIIDLTSVFRIMTGETAQESIKYIYGLNKFAQETGADVRALSKDMAEAGKEQFKYANLTKDEFAQQAALLNKMGSSMVTMQKATDTMVGSYKESIKAEMSLSAMIGRRVNLSGVRSRLLAGDTTGAASILQTQLRGMNVENMNYFAKQQLMQATGLDMNSLMDLSRGDKLGTTQAKLEKDKAFDQGKNIAAGMRAVELENRAAELKLEQSQRFANLVVEQKFRLDMVRQEFELRQQLDKLEAEQRTAEGLDKFFAEAMASQFASTLPQIQSTILQNLTAQGIGGTQFEQAQAYLANQDQKIQGIFAAFASLNAQGKVNNNNLVDIALSVQKAYESVGKSMIGKDGKLDLSNRDMVGELLKNLPKGLAIMLQSELTKPQAQTASEIEALRQQSKKLTPEQQKKIDDLNKQYESRSGFGKWFYGNQHRTQIANETGAFEAKNYAAASANQTGAPVNQTGATVNQTGATVNQTKATQAQIKSTDAQTSAIVKQTKAIKRWEENGVAYAKAGNSKSNYAITKPQMISDWADSNLTDSTIQQEQTALLRLMVEALFDIDENTAKTAWGATNKGMQEISIDGKRLNRALSLVKNKGYALGNYATGTVKANV